MQPFQIVKTNSKVFGNNYEICKQIMDDQGFSFVEYVDMMFALKKGRGKINPSNGFVIVAPKEVVMTDYIQLFRYMEREGLVRI